MLIQLITNSAHQSFNGVGGAVVVELSDDLTVQYVVCVHTHSVTVEQCVCGPLLWQLHLHALLNAQMKKHQLSSTAGRRFVVQWLYARRHWD